MVSVGVPQVLLRVLRHEVGGRVGLQVGQARAAVVRGRGARHSAHAAHSAHPTAEEKRIYGDIVISLFKFIFN